MSTHLAEWYNQAVQCFAEDRFDEAERLLLEIEKRSPNHPLVLSGLAFVEYSRQAYPQAIRLYQKALKLDDNQPESHNNLGSALWKIEKHIEALRSYTRAIQLKTDYAEAYYNRAVVWETLGQTRDALRDYESALKYQPGNARASLNRGFIHLFHLDFAAGWSAYEARWHVRELNARPLGLTLPEWHGDALQGRLLVWDEQGVGDQVLFASLLPALRERVGQISLRVDDRLVSLFARSLPDIEVLPASQPLDTQRYDQQIALGSLPRHFLGQAGDFTRLAFRYLQPDPIRREQLKAAWAGMPRPWLGVAWRSINPHHDKSIPIEQIATALRGYPGTLINLQYRHSAAELDTFDKIAGQPLVNDPQLDLFNDLEAVVALISLCDRVVTISNVTAHLSGAQGVDTLLMVPGTTMHRHWYWHANQGRSLWYPTVRVHTQSVIGRWQKVLGQVRKEVMG